jgi:hypothetical protein
MAQIILDSNNNLIQGDFDNATLNNRTKLQTTTTNATSNVYVVPNGSATSAGVSIANNSDLTNASKIVMATNGSTDTQIISGVNGSGSYLPLSFYTNNTLAVQIATTGATTLSGAGRAAITTDNDLSFNMNTASNFSCTPTGTGALTFTNIASGQSGFILLINSGGYAITAAATTKVGASMLATISAAGTYLLSYFSNGTNVYVTNSGALS